MTLEQLKEAALTYVSDFSVYQLSLDEVLAVVLLHVSTQEHLHYSTMLLNFDERFF